MSDKKGITSTITENHALHKEWDEALCPICMDHPHNAVLLVCSSHDKGCRSYICDTSYRHSNCLDRYKRLTVDLNDTTLPNSSQPENPDGTSGGTIEWVLGTRTHMEEAQEHNNGTSSGIAEILGENNSQAPYPSSEFQGEITSEMGNSSDKSLNLKCPLCRGNVIGRKIVKEAREYLDLKHRSCSGDSCSFSGNYRELRRHARRIHPSARPSDVNPLRQVAWRHLEGQREYNDIISAIRSVTPSAVVFGDYVIDNVGNNRESGLGGGNGSGFADTFFLFQMLSSSRREPWNSSRAVRRRRGNRSAGSSGRRYPWRENVLDLQDDAEGWNPSNDLGEEEDVSPVPRRCRRFTQSRPDENP